MRMCVCARQDVYGASGSLSSCFDSGSPHSGCAHVAVSSGAEGTVRVGGTRERPESWSGLSLTRDAEQA